ARACPFGYMPVKAYSRTGMENARLPLPHGPPLPDVHRDLMVGDALVPAAQRRPGRFLHDRPLIVGPGEAADRVEAGEPGDGGERDLAVLVPPQELRAAEPADRPQVLADFALVMPLVVTSPFRGRPAPPDPRDHDLIVSSGVNRGTVVEESWHGVLRSLAAP